MIDVKTVCNIAKVPSNFFIQPTRPPLSERSSAIQACSSKSAAIFALAVVSSAPDQIEPKLNFDDQIKFEKWLKNLVPRKIKNYFKFCRNENGQILYAKITNCNKHASSPPPTEKLPSIRAYHRHGTGTER